jgi:hypothetical protein
LDVRAYGCLVEDLISICFEENHISFTLEEIRDMCLKNKVLDRPGFEEVIGHLTSLL